MSFILMMLGQGLPRNGPRWWEMDACGATAGTNAALDAVAEKLLCGGRDTHQQPFDRMHAELAWINEKGGNVAAARAAYARLSARGEAPQWARQRYAATCLITGETHTAIAIYQNLATDARGSVLPWLVLGELLLAGEKSRQAATAFMAGVHELMKCGDPLETTLVDRPRFPAEFASPFPLAESEQSPKLARHLAAAREYLGRGRYVRAVEAVDHAIALADALLLAHTGLALAWLKGNPDESATILPDYIAESLTSLARLGDSLIRYHARVQMAAAVAAGLRKRDLRPDLAAWATPLKSVEAVLAREYERLGRIALSRPNHIELHARMATLARAVGDFTGAGAAFKKSLRLHPHDSLTAAKLVATQLGMGEFARANETLLEAFSPAPNTLRQFYNLGVAFGDADRFARTVSTLERDLGEDAARPEMKANLGAALASMGLFNDQLQSWCEPAEPAAAFR